MIFASSHPSPTCSRRPNPASSLSRSISPAPPPSTATSQDPRPHRISPASLAANNLRVNGSTWRVFRTGVDASPSEARLINADLEPLPKGRINLNASVGLNQWAFTNASPLQIQLDASQLDIASLTKLAGQQQLPVSGTLNTHLTLHGTEENPIGNGTLSITNASAYSEPINSVQVNFGGTGDQAQATLSIKLPAGSIESNVTVRPKQKTYTAQLTSTGIDIQKLETVKAKNLDATGTVANLRQRSGQLRQPAAHRVHSDPFAHHPEAAGRQRQARRECCQSRRQRNALFRCAQHQHPGQSAREPHRRLRHRRHARHAEHSAAAARRALLACECRNALRRTPNCTPPCTALRRTRTCSRRTSPFPI